ncbi:MAG: PhzF family phenazine biosynthesis protein [Deltaproteobacteria bacterium]|nr:PhzF family phenazine biosynthesis protein [Deltaproteobacteria bacterium]
MIRKVFLVDTLVDGPFSGSQTTVVFLESPLDKFKMLSLANELGTSQTVFVYYHGQAYLLRYFVRTQEITLSTHCCHAVAHLIFELGMHPPGEKLLFLTQEGEITAARIPPDLISVTLPAQNITKLDQAKIELYSSILSLNPKTVIWGALAPSRTVVLAVDASVQLRKLNVDNLKLADSGAMALAVTKQDTGAADYALRCFTSIPNLPEQSISAGLQRSLAPHWGRLLNKKALQAKQLSPRGGLIELDVSIPNQIVITGRSKTVLRSDLVLEMIGDIPVTVVGQ